ncbi:hypothetical protein SAMN04489761_2213 [Tenacibaculum sp. MAR_2009_124]|nr:hypothetical protein SAMN04489761_2213 [Tenacibaculum sp. MAR_2009_124]
MCRYAEHVYKSHFVCFKCQKGFKRRLLVDFSGEKDQKETVSHCPNCRSIMTNVGKDCEIPRKTDVKKWKFLKDLIELGISYHSCGCSGPGYIPRNRMELS